MFIHGTVTSVHDPRTVCNQTCTEMPDLRTLLAALTVKGGRGGGLRNEITQNGSKCFLACLCRFPLKLRINADEREQR